MNELLEAVIDNVSLFLLDKGYSKKGKKEFIKKNKENGREEIITFSNRKGRGDYSNYIYIGVTSGIYYKKVNFLDKKIIKDFLNSYPIVSGSISHFKKLDSGFMSIPMNNLEQTEEVSKIIINNIEEGAFNLYNTYPDLKSILFGVKRKDEWLKEYSTFLDFRHSIRLAAMYCIEESKNFAISWFSDLKLESKEEEKKDILNRMQIEW